jgi:hypothetical protein
VHLVLAEALAANGEDAAARATLAGAAARLRARAAELGNAEWRRSFLAKVPDNARTLVLAREWGIADADDRPAPARGDRPTPG